MINTEVTPYFVENRVIMYYFLNSVYTPLKWFEPHMFGYIISKFLQLFVMIVFTKGKLLMHK